MTTAEKTEQVKLLLGIAAGDMDQDSLISAYLTLAEKEIISWRYSYTGRDVTAVPAEYETTQIMAVVAGFSQGGAENQTRHSENGIDRYFKYEDMVAYIRAHVIPIARIQ